MDAELAKNSAMPRLLTQLLFSCHSLQQDDCAFADLDKLFPDSLVRLISLGPCKLMRIVCLPGSRARSHWKLDFILAAQHGIASIARELRKTRKEDNGTVKLHPGWGFPPAVAKKTKRTFFGVDHLPALMSPNPCLRSEPAP
jgi:hypothetical protein